MQAQADLLQVPIDVYPSAHATPLGAAACGRLSVDPSATLEEVTGTWAPEQAYEPQWTADRAGSFRDAWRRAAGATLSQEDHP